MNTPNQQEKARSTRAYEAGARVTRERMRREAPLDAAALEQIEASDIVVVKGIYDHVELVLDALGLPYLAIEAADFGRVSLSPDQLLVINCPGQLGERAIPRVRTFVEMGGSLFTTDWALKHVLEPAFPGLVAYNNRPTTDDVVRLEVCSKDNPFLAGVLQEGDDPVWWLEASSYPIRILNPARVQVLLKSGELKAKYGEEPVALTFAHGRGEVFHLISHYYLQRTELRSARHHLGAEAYAAAKGVPMSRDLAEKMEGLCYGDVEAAESSTRLFANIAARKKGQSG